MVATVRFGPGRISTPNAKSSLFAILSANFLTLVGIICASLGLWRFGADVDVARDFVFQNGFLSHWQVWVGLAVGVQYASWRLNHFARSEAGREGEIARMAELSTVRTTAEI